MAGLLKGFPDVDSTVLCSVTLVQMAMITCQGDGIEILSVQWYMQRPGQDAGWTYMTITSAPEGFFDAKTPAWKTWPP